MPRFTTIAAVIAPRAGELVHAAAADATNVTGVQIGDFAGPDEASCRRAAWSEARRRRNVYTLIDFDPLADLVDAWIGRLRERSHSLEAAVGSVEKDGLAEYVLVSDDLEGDVVHWYHGLLRSYAPARVITIEPRPGSILDALAHLKPSVAFPDAGTLAQAALEYVPTGISLDVAPDPEIVLRP